MRQRSLMRMGIALCALLLGPVWALGADESWFVSTMAGARLGYVHESVSTGPDGRVVTEASSRLLVRRGEDVARLDADERWVESAAGAPVSYSSVRRLSLTVTELDVSAIREGVLTLRKAAGDDVSHSTIEYEGAILFPQALVALHVDRGFVPGDRYSYAYFDPDFEEVGHVQVTVVGEESVVALGEPRRLSRLVLRSDLYPGVDTVEWRDGEGRLWRSEIETARIAQERTTREAALEEKELADLIASTSIPVEVKIDEPSRVDSAVYEVWVDGGDIARLLPQDARQRIVERTARGVLLGVRRTVPASSDPNPPAAGMEPYLEGNALMQTWYPLLIAAAAKSVRGAEDDRWEGARRIERFVYDTIDEKGFGTAFGSAAEVLGTRSGDCSEHAVLMAAMTRAVGIPSKLVSGLAYFRGAFAYHMWVDVWVGGGWFALDPTLGSGAVDATHIKLAESAGQDGVVADLSAGVLATLGRLHVRVVEYSPRG